MVIELEQDCIFPAIHKVPGRLIVGVPDAEVDEVLSTTTSHPTKHQTIPGGLHAELLIDLIERHEAPDSQEIVQIGLLPNTNWLEGAIERNRMGEIIIDAKCETNVKGVFAAGDCTTVPYKQIIIATGEGAKASLSSFDYLIRTKTA